MQRLTSIVSGRVQKAGYRGKVVTIARALELRGYVQNLPDGRVKVVAEGDRADLERFANALMMRNSIIYVTDIEKKFAPASGDFEIFAKIVEEGETDSHLDAGVELLKELIVLTRQSVSLQEKMLGKQDQTLEKLDEVQESVVGEIRELRSDIKPLLEDRLGRIESDVSRIKAKMGLQEKELAPIPCGEEPSGNAKPFSTLAGLTRDSRRALVPRERAVGN